MLISHPTVYIDKFTPAKVPLGHWMAINPDDESEVVASAPELEIAVETAKMCGFQKTMVVRASLSNCVNQNYKEQYIHGKKCD